MLAGRYRITAQLGRGGMGVVWKAVDEVLGREVAVKELRTYTDADAPELADLRLRMQREARAAARVRHPGVVAVHDVTEVDGRPLIVMELVDGPSLDDVLRERGTLDPHEAARIGAEVMGALAAAHRAGVLHRDVKPGNILLDRSGRVVLTDFGIATMEDPGDGSATHLTRSGEIVGSLDYLAPERAQGADPGPASDVWALGATLYAAVEGASPFRRTSTFSTLTAIVTEPLPEPRRAGPLGPVLRQLMDKRSESRPEAGRAGDLLRAVADPDGAERPGTARPGPSAPPPYAVTERSVPSVPPGFGPPRQPPPSDGPVVHHGAASVGPGGLPGTPGSAAAGPVHQGAVSVGPGAAPATDASAPTAPPRRRGRALLAAAAVTAVLAVAGTTVALLGGPDGGGSGAPAGAGRTGPPTSSPGRTTAGPTEGAPHSGPSDDKGPAAEGTPGRSTPAPGDRAGESAPAGSSDGGTTGGAGGSGDGGTTGGGTTGGGSGTGGAATGGGTTGGGGSTEAPASCYAIGGGRYNCQVWRTASSHTASGTEVGILNAGTNYFYCQQNLGRRVTHGRWTNIWWARTDDDSGNTDVWFSDVYIRGGANDQPVPGLPVC
ncbi:protein kinase [Streptomyces sp. C6-003]